MGKVNGRDFDDRYSGADEAYMSGEDYAALQGHKQAWSSAGDPAEKQAAHDAAELLRAKYSYSGGADGGGYKPFNAQDAATVGKGGFRYESAPEYTGRYQEQIDALTKNLLSREEFQYSAEDDPLFKQYKESYTRSGERAMQDALGQMSARTGGLASSYAGTAAQQSYNGYMDALNDKIPELQQLAYSMYQDQGDQKRADLNMLMALEQGDYAKYADLMGQYNTDRNFNYGVGRDGISDDRYNAEWNYGVGRDQIADGRYMDETSYNREQDAWEKGNYESERTYNQALQKAQNLAAASGDFSGYKAIGYTDEEIEGMKQQRIRDQAADMLVRGGGGGGRKGSDETTGVLESMYALGSDSAAYEYLLGLDFSNEKSNSLWSLYQNGGSMPSENYTSVLSNAKSYYAQDPSAAEAYIDRMMNSGYITQDEAADILEIELGIDIYETSAKSPTPPRAFADATENPGKQQKRTHEWPRLPGQRS